MSGSDLLEQSQKQPTNSMAPLAGLNKTPQRSINKKMHPQESSYQRSEDHSHEASSSGLLPNKLSTTQDKLNRKLG